VTPLRLQLLRRKGYSLQAASRAANGLPAVKVDRSTRRGNPYRVVVGDVIDAITDARRKEGRVVHAPHACLPEDVAEVASYEG
jgi:hypothetical protein